MSDHSVFWRAVKSGDIQCIRNLISRNEADLVAMDTGGCTALGIAVQEGHRDLIQLLIKSGADVNHQDLFSRSPLHYAVETEQEDLVSLLLESGAEVNWRAEQTLSPLHIAACKGQEVIIRILIKYGADVNAKDQDGVSVLHCAVANEREAVVSCLLDNGADPNPRGLTSGRSPLFLACDVHSLDLVQMLVRRGARVNITDRYGLTPLCACCIQNETAISKFLISCGAKVNTEDYKKNSPIFYAARNGNIELLDVLIHKGGKIDQENEDEVTPLLAAINMQRTECIVMLLRNGSNPNGVDPGLYPHYPFRPLHRAVISYDDIVDFKRIFHEFVRCGADINICKKSSQETALYLALHHNKPEMAVHLIQHGADVNVQCPMGQTILYKACQKKLSSVVDFILRADIKWSGERWINLDIHRSGINQKLLIGYQHDIPMILLRQPDLFYKIEYNRYNAKTLASISRNVIRKAMQDSLQEKIDKLCLPQRISEFLMLQIL